MQQKLNFGKDRVDHISKFTKNRIVTFQKIIGGQIPGYPENPLTEADPELRIQKMRKVDQEPDLYDSDDEMFYYDF